MKTILVVEDDPQIQALIKRALERHEYSVMCADDATAAGELLRVKPADLVLLDIRLPGMSGIDFCRELRKESDVPVIFVSGEDTDIDRIVGLEIGADDYLTKPFNMRELVARVSAVLRRTNGQPVVVADAESDDDVLVHGLVDVDLESRDVVVNGNEVERLTPIEFNLLRTLIRRPRKVFTRDELREGAYPPNTYVDDKTITTHVRNLRRKLREASHDPIESERGIGYRMAKIR